MKENKAIVWGIWVFTFVVWGLVVVLHELPGAESMPAWMGKLPMLHALINGTCALLLIASLLAVKRKNIARHRLFNTAAMALSVLFLISYVIYNYFAGDTSYGGDYRGLYLFILISHIVLAGLSLPFILLAYYRGMSGSVMKHKRLVRFTYPVWLYVCVTGVLVYLFLAPYYGQ